MLRLVVVKPTGGGGTYGNLTLDMAPKAINMLLNDQSVPRAARNKHKITQLARDLIGFCRQNGIQRLTLNRQQCLQFLSIREIPNAQHVVAAIDKNNDGQCDFREIVIGIVTAGNINAGPIDQAKLLFDSYDNDKSGTLDPPEVRSLVYFFCSVPSFV